jgi:PadR family transcriptional regulator, regulatory protein PadR
VTEQLDVQLKKGALELCVLHLLSNRDHYGYEVATRLAAGIGMSEGTIYPLMRRMLTDGLVETYLVESRSGPSRKYYRLTKSGRLTLDRHRHTWRTFSRAINQILEGRK